MGSQSRHDLETKQEEEKISEKTSVIHTWNKIGVNVFSDHSISIHQHEYIGIQSQYIWVLSCTSCLSAPLSRLIGCRPSIPAYFFSFCILPCRPLLWNRRYWICCCKQSHSAFEHLKVRFEFLFASLFYELPWNSTQEEEGLWESEQPGFKSRLLSFLAV